MLYEFLKNNYKEAEPIFSGILGSTGIITAEIARIVSHNLKKKTCRRRRKISSAV